MKKKKTIKEIEGQYKRILKTAFPKLRFTGIFWNWGKVYDGDPFKNKKFIRINKAWVNTAKKYGHPFYK